MASGLTGSIVFSSGKHGDYDIWSLDLDANKLTKLTNGKSWNDKPRFSPDGRSVVFVSNESGTPDIYSVNVDGGPVKPLIQNGRWNDFPALSPDGSKLGFVSNVSGDNDIWIADADGTNPRQITRHPGDDTFFDWTPDGRSVLFSSDREGNADIFRYDLKSGRKHQLTTDIGLDIHPAPSPNGNYIAFVSNRQFAPDKCKDDWDDRDLDLWLMRADGTHQVRITDNQGCDRCVAWSPQGTHLIFASSAESESAERLRIVDVTELAAAFDTGNADSINRLADRLRSASLQLNRGRLEREIGAQRHPFFLTSLLPDFLMRRIYDQSYWGGERFPDWHVGSSAEFGPRVWDSTHHFV